MISNFSPDLNALVVGMIDDEPVPPSGQPDSPGLLTSLVNIPLLGIQQGVAKIARMVETPITMDGNPVAACAITVSADGQGVTLNAPYNMECVIPFSRMVALVERLCDPANMMVVIQEHSIGDRREPSRRQILGYLDPYHSSLTVLQSYRGEYLAQSNRPEVTQIFYLDRRELLTFYLVAKLHLSGVRRREDMDPYILGWQPVEARHNQDSGRNTE